MHKNLSWLFSGVCSLSLGLQIARRRFYLCTIGLKIGIEVVGIYLVPRAPVMIYFGPRAPGM